MLILATGDKRGFVIVELLKHELRYAIIFNIERE